MERLILPSLLFRQTLILALIAGACAVRSPAVAAGMLVLIAFVPKKEKGSTFALRILKLLAMFLAGLAVMYFRMPEVPDKPSWASVPRQSVLVEGTIESVTGLPGGRVRMLLGELRKTGMPADVDSGRAEKLRKAMEAPRFSSSDSGRKSYAGGLFHDDEAALPGLAALTLEAGQLEYGRPAAGQKMTALVRLFPSGGSRNAAENGASAYWASREVWHNARLVRQRGEPLFLRVDDGEGWRSFIAMKREGWRSDMEALLFPEEAERGTAVDETPRQGRAMLTALLFGDRSGLSLRTIDLFTRAGLVHSLALSGQHLALAALAGMLFVFLLSLFLPDLYRRCPKRTIVACAGLPFALGYLFLGGAPFSLMRAAVMLTAGAIFLCIRRTTAPLDALFAAIFLLFLAWPQAVFNLSAQLSVLAVAGILLSLPVLSFVRKRLTPRSDAPFLSRLGRKGLILLLSLLIVSFAAQAAVLPVLASAFGAVSPCVWLNVLWLPPLTFITLPLAALGLVLLIAFGPQSFSALLFNAAACPADIMVAFLEMLDSGGWLPFIQCFRPAPLSALGYGAVLTALAFVVQAKMMRRAVSSSIKRLCCFGILFMLAGQMPQWLDDLQSRVEERITLTMIDVGAGQAVLMEYPGGRVLIDGGGNSTPFFDCGRSIVAPHLTERRLPRLDAVIVSHCDVDHARGLRWILEHFSVDALYWSPFSAQHADRNEGLALREAAKRRGISEKVVKRGDALELGNGLKLEVLSPGLAGEVLPPSSRQSSNNASLALRLSHKGRGLALLCGDMLSPALRFLALSGQELSAEVLVLPHHGAASSFQKKFYKAVSPSAALASAAPFNHYGFPSRKVRDEMERRGIPVLSTSELGTFSLRWKKKDGEYRLELPEKRQ